MSNYVIWGFPQIENAAQLTERTGLDDGYKLHKGLPASELEETDISFNMDPEAPENMMLTDSLYNIFRLNIVSEKIKTIIADLQLDYISFLPVSIINHKGRETEEPYFLLHPEGTVDCLNADASDIKYGRIVKTKISRVKKLVLDYSAIPDDRPICRIDNFGGHLLVRRDIAESLDNAGVTGIRWVEVDEFRY